MANLFLSKMKYLGESSSFNGRQLTVKEFALKVRPVKETPLKNWRQILIVIVSVIALLGISEQLSVVSEAEFVVDSSLVEREASGDFDDLYPLVALFEALTLHGRPSLYWSVGTSVIFYNPHFSPEARAGPLSS